MTDAGLVRSAAASGLLSHCQRTFRCSYAGKGGRAITVGRNPYRGPAPAAPAPTPASAMPPSRFPAPTASGVWLPGGEWAGHDGGFEPISGTNAGPTRDSPSSRGHAAHQVSGPGLR